MDIEQSRTVMALLNGGGLVLIIAAILFTLRMYRTKGEIRRIEDISTHVKEVTAIAQMGVMSAKQLYESGQIGKEERFPHADQFVEEVFPFMTESQRRTLVEGAVIAVDAIREFQN